MIPLTWLPSQRPAAACSPWPRQLAVFVVQPIVLPVKHGDRSCVDGQPKLLPLIVKAHDHIVLVAHGTLFVGAECAEKLVRSRGIDQQDADPVEAQLAAGEFHCLLAQVVQ